MTLGELIRRFRTMANDRVQPYFCSDEDVKDWLNDAQDQACVRGRLLRDDSTPDVCQIVLTPSQPVYPLHRRLYEIISLRVKDADGKSRPMRLVSREWLDAERCDWRDETRETCFAIQDENSIRIVGAIKAGEVLHIECYRLPLDSMVNGTDEPEIHEAHHDHLIQWALHEAFSIPDAEMFDAQRAEKAEREFSSYFGLMPDADMRRITRHDVAHHNATFLL